MTASRTRSRAGLRVAGVVGGALAAAVLWLLAVPVGGAVLSVTTAGQQPMVVGPVLVMGAAIIGGSAGWASLAMLERFLVRARTLWLGAVAVVLVLTGVNAATAGGSTAAAVWLNLMHLAVAGVVVPVLARTSPRR